MNQFIGFDQYLFLLINHLPHTHITDAVAKFFSLIGTVGVVWLVIGGLLFLKEEKKHHMFFAPIIGAGALSYVVVELMIKPLVARVRPTVEMGAIIVGSRKTDASFPSGHATIAFAMAVVLSSYEPKLRWLFYTLAVCISLSRIFVGAHYPSDVLFGAFLGWSIGACMLWARKQFKWHTRSV